jgi:hypothetical protein
MLHEKTNRKSREYRMIHDMILSSYNENELSHADLKYLGNIIEYLQKNPNTTFHVPYTEVIQKDKDGDDVHYNV